MPGIHVSKRRRTGQSSRYTLPVNLRTYRATMDNPYKLRRGGGTKPRSRVGAPEVRCVYHQGKLLTPEVLSSTVPLNRETKPVDEDGLDALSKRFELSSLSSPRGTSKS